MNTNDIAGERLADRRQRTADALREVWQVCAANVAWREPRAVRGDRQRRFVERRRIRDEAKCAWRADGEVARRDRADRRTCMREARRIAALRWMLAGRGGD